MASLKWYGCPHASFRGQDWSKGQIQRVLEDEGCSVTYHRGFKYFFIEHPIPDEATRDEMVKIRKRIDAVIKSKLLRWKPSFAGLNWNAPFSPESSDNPFGRGP